MQQNLIEEFIAWAEAKFRSSYPDVEVVKCTPTDNPACYVHIESDIGMGRITVWADGCFEKQYLGLDNNITPILESGENLQTADFEKNFNDIIDFLST